MLALGLGAGGGCRTPQGSSSLPTTPLRSYAPVFPPEPADAPPPASRALTPSPALPPIVEAPRTAATATNLWVSLATWAALQGLDRPEPVPSSVAPTRRIRSPRGALEAVVGTRTIRWNGTQHWLGFAPRVNQGQFEVYGLDLEKNFDPLLIGRCQRAAPRRVLVIDPGHGGEDTGAQSVASQRCEKDYTLDWARRLQGGLAARGWAVFLTRTNDAEQSLSNRVALAQAKQADLFVSLHFNSAPLNRSRSGLETYCLTPSGLPSTLLRDSAEDPRQVFPNNAFDAQNLELAARLHSGLVTATGGVDGGVRRARFMGVLRGQNRPAILIEGGYLSHPQEAELIARPSYRQKLAEALARAVAVYAESPSEGLAAGSPENRSAGAGTASGR